MWRAAQTLAVAFPSHRPRPLTGEVELGVALAAQSVRQSRPDAVTAVLAQVFSEIGGLATEVGDIWRLASGTREWLLQRAAGLFWRETGWFQAKCAECDTAYDLPMRLDAAPRKAAQEPFPIVSLRTSLGLRKFEVPNGLHEQALSQGCSDDAPERALLAACGLGRSAEADARAFSAADLRSIEEALEAAAPDIADEVQTVCPTCKSQALARIDPLTFAFPDTKGLLAQVHALAATYHWSEEAILALPSARRRAYAALIAQERRR